LYSSLAAGAGALKELIIVAAGSLDSRFVQLVMPAAASDWDKKSFVSVCFQTSKCADIDIDIDHPQR
jgi:hypothetical protein